MAVLESVNVAEERYFGHNLRDYMLHLTNNNIYDVAIELEKGVKIYVTKTTSVPDSKGAVHNYIELYAGRGGNFTVKASTRNVNWEETDKLGIYKPKWRK